MYSMYESRVTNPNPNQTFRVFVSRYVDERALSYLVAGIRVSSILQQPGADSIMTVLTCKVKGCPPILQRIGRDGLGHERQHRVQKQNAETGQGFVG